MMLYGIFSSHCIAQSVSGSGDSCPTDVDPAVSEKKRYRNLNDGAKRAVTACGHAEILTVSLSCYICILQTFASFIFLRVNNNCVKICILNVIHGQSTRRSRLVGPSPPMNKSPGEWSFW